MESEVEMLGKLFKFKPRVTDISEREFDSLFDKYIALAQTCKDPIDESAKAYLLQAIHMRGIPDSDAYTIEIDDGDPPQTDEELETDDAIDMEARTLLIHRPNEVRKIRQFVPKPRILPVRKRLLPEPDFEVDQ
jgi:hypothetical protein